MNILSNHVCSRLTFLIYELFCIFLATVYVCGCPKLVLTFLTHILFCCFYLFRCVAILLTLGIIAKYMIFSTFYTSFMLILVTCCYFETVNTSIKCKTGLHQVQTQVIYLNYLYTLQTKNKIIIFFNFV